MNREFLKVGSHVIADLSPTLRGLDAIVRGEYVGWADIPGSGGMACIRKEGGDQVVMILFGEHLKLDRRYHYDRTYADSAENGYGPKCLCGHHYSRHFDGYVDRDPLYQDLPDLATCKYCDCPLFVEQTAENIRNHLYDRNTYKVRLTKGFIAHRGLSSDGYGKSTEYQFSEGDVLSEVTVMRGTSTGCYSVYYVSGEAEYCIWALPADAVEILEERGTSVSTEA